MDNSVDVKLKKTFLWSTILQFSTVCLQFISTIVLARYLTPEDYGIMGAVAIFIAIGDMLVDSGMGGSLVKKQDVTEVDYSTLFVCNLSLSVFLYLILYIIAPLIANFFRIYPNLELVVRIVSVVIIVHAISIVQRIKFLKELRYKELTITTIVAHIIGFFFALTLAKCNLGVWALISQSIVIAIVSLILYLYFNKYIPSFVFSYKSFRIHFMWGVRLMIANTINVVNDNIYSSVIAKISTTTLTGYYSQSMKIRNLPIGVITQIVDKAVFPVLSQCIIDEFFKIKVSSLNRLILLIVTPILLLIAAFSEFIIIIILGEQWINAGWILKMLTFSGIPICIQVLYRNIFKSMGNTTVILKNEAIKMIISLLILGISAFLGFKMIIYGALLSSLLGVFCGVFMMSRCLNYSIKEQISDLLNVLLICLIPYYLIFYLIPSILIIPDFMFMLLKTFLYVILIVCLSFLFKVKEFFLLKEALYKILCRT